MDSSALQRWINDRAASDDELDELIVHRHRHAEHHDTGDSNILELLSRQHGGSPIGRSPNLRRDHATGHQRIWADYFSENPTYPSQYFRRRLRMKQSVFMRIHDSVVAQCPYFVQRRDAVGNPGLSSVQKMVAAMRMFSYGLAGDAVDEYVRIRESTAIQAFKTFAEAIVVNFQDEYLRDPTPQDIQRQMDINAERGFPGMFGSLDCTHWTWKNCPVGLQGQYRDKDGINSIVLEAIATKNLWIWHACIDVPGSNNDSNVVDRSPLLVNMLNGVAPDVTYHVNNHEYGMFYLLCDGIYPDFTIFMKTIPDPQTAKAKYFAKKQEAIRKDVERCFGVLQARFAMVHRPAHWWRSNEMITFWKAAIIMHNMIVEDKEPHPEFNNDYLFENNHVAINHWDREPLSFAGLSMAVQSIRNVQAITQLQLDVQEHLWQQKGMGRRD